MRYRLITLLAPVLLALLLGSGATANASSGAASGTASCGSYADKIPTSRNRSQVRMATLCLVNRERMKRGRVKLRRNRTLEGVAARYTKRMIAEEFFDHVSPDGSTLADRVKRTSYIRGTLKRWSLGENIAWGTGHLSTPRSIVAGWMKSSGHRDNILRRGFREAGFGVIAAVPDSSVGGRAATFTNVFGARVHR
ncbi:MAG: CAP domain-containing protein [Solirubrobacterales bacterium]|nr:CAP domain-containing protein [Solirubrobacterales bacterium]